VTTIAGRSLWADTLPDAERATGSPSGTHDTPASGVPTSADVAIVGAGLTGLWTAWYLLERDPTLRVVVIERDTIGFGASGRNGGWCSPFLPMSLPTVATRHGDAAAHRMQVAMHHTVAAVGAFVDEHGAPGMFQRGGSITLARSRPQADRLRAHVHEQHRFGFDDTDYRWVGPDEARSMCGAADVLGGVFTPHCAAVHPLRLTHAVARAVLATGATILEHTEVERIERGRAVTSSGTIRADVVVRATEGYTPQLPGERRTLLPIYSLMIATEPLPQAVWDHIGLHDRPTFADGRHLIIYGQRTADDRLAFGGRGAPYHFGSVVRPEFDTDDRIRQLLTDSLRQLLPVIGDAVITHHWGGVLAAPRDWACSVRFDRTTGLATAGGYVGDGLSTTNLAGRTLAALIAGHDDRDEELVRLPWVGHRSRRWEPEPLRWIGVNAARAAARRADLVEERTGHTSRMWGGAIDMLLRR
jgi:glycine/D-amino acid oxidase-like deaminating enzyme